MVALKSKKPTVIAVPQSYAAANALVERYGALARELERAETDLSQSVAALKVQIETRIAPLIAERKTIEAQLEAYGEDNRDELTGHGKLKHHALPAGRIGWRNDPPSIQFKKGTKADDVIATLREMRLVRFLRRVWTINKEAGVEQFYIESAAIELSGGEP